MPSPQTPILISTIGILLFQSPTANAKPGWVPTGNVLTWADGSTITVDSLDCVKSGYSGLVVAGTVTLVYSHPNALAPQSIRLLCPYILFRTGAQILTREMIDFKISAQAVGPVKIINTRGDDGADAPVDDAAKKRSDEIWKITKEPKAPNGGTGGNGRNAETDLKGNWSADEGGGGGAVFTARKGQMPLPEILVALAKIPPASN